MAVFNINNNYNNWNDRPGKIKINTTPQVGPHQHKYLYYTTGKLSKMDTS